MLLFLLLQFINTQLGLVAIGLLKEDLEDFPHCNSTTKGEFSMTGTADCLPASLMAEFKKYYYKYPDLPTEGPGFLDPLPEGYEPEPTHRPSVWRWDLEAAKAGGDAGE